MKELTFPSKVSMFFSSILDTLVEEDSPAKERQAKKSTEGQSATAEKLNREERKDFFYYKPVIDQDTQQIIGHLADMSTGGFKLDSQNPIPINKDFRFRLDLSGEVADKPSMVFVARSKWCRVDPLDPYNYNVGYQLLNITPGDLQIFIRMMEKYGRKQEKRTIDLHRSNKW